MSPIHLAILELLEEWSPQYLTDTELTLLGSSPLSRASSPEVREAISDLRKAGLLRAEPAEYTRHQKMRTLKLWRTEVAR